MKQTTHPKAMVKCYVCGEMFDRANNPYVQKQLGEKRFRYAHPDCEPTKPILFPNDRCDICGRADNSFKIDFLPNTTLKVHPECLQNYQPDEKQKLIDYCRSLFGKDDLAHTPILRTIKIYNEQNHYSFSAIRKTLMWWYDIKGNDVSKANGNIRIVPYIIDQARDYWKTREQADQSNEKIDIKPIEEVKISIRQPKRERFHTSSFNFLDEENANGQ